MQQQNTQKETPSPQSKKILYIVLVAVFLLGIFTLVVLLDKDRPMTERQIERAFRQMEKVPVESTMTQEEITAAFDEMEKVPVESTMTQEEITTALDAMEI